MGGWQAVIAGYGGYLPSNVVSNDDLAQTVDTSHEWIVARTGITQRHVAAAGELTSDLGTAAAQRALDDAGLTPAAVDLIVVATSTPDNTFPATATAIQHKLGAPAGIAFDVQAVCAGFVFAVAVADNFIRLGQAKTALVIGAETFSRILDWQDRSTCVLFGDGAGALVLSAEARNGRARGVLATHLSADGRYYDKLFVDGGAGRDGRAGHLRMAGQDVFRFAVPALADGVNRVLAQSGEDLAALDLLVPHQANKRIIDAVGQRLDLRDDQVVVTVDRHANTSAASIPLALADARDAQRLRSGQLVAITGIGGGFAWGAGLLRL